jgi:hypothetical protein
MRSAMRTTRDSQELGEQRLGPVGWIVPVSDEALTPVLGNQLPLAS